MRVPLHDFGCAITRKIDNDNEKGKKWKTESSIYSEKHIWTQDCLGKERYYSLEEEFGEIWLDLKIINRHELPVTGKSVSEEGTVPAWK